jgi:glutamate-1-semialdehyde 2,1-aminomutase
MAHRKAPPASGARAALKSKPFVAPSGALARLLGEYTARTGASRAFHERIGKSLAGGETREVTFYEPYPFAVARAEGALLVDLDGNEYLDLNNNMASLIHGHRYPPIMRALADAGSELGTVQSGPHRVQLEFAELIVDRFPACERIRFTNSGSEAAELALRIARRATGRERLVMVDGGYHGMGAEFSDPRPDVVRVPFNDLGAMATALDDTVAAVFAESFLGHAGVVPAEAGFLEALADLARDRGALFVLDEVQSMRNDYRAHHGALGIAPDLVVMGKSLGGGLPIGLVGGRAELVELASIARPDGIRHSGTFNGNVLTCAAGRACLQELGPNEIASLNERSERLAAKLQTAARDMDLPLVVTRSGSTMCMHFLEQAPRNAQEAMPSAGISQWVHIAALCEGVFLIRGGRLNLSTALTERDLDRAGDALVRALGRLVEIRASEGSG